MKHFLFLLMALAILALTACGPVESAAAAPRSAAAPIATSTPTPTVTPQKNTSDQLLLLGLTATVEFRGTATQRAQVAATAAAAQTQIAQTATQKWEALTLTPAAQAMNQTKLDQAKAQNDIDADKAKKDADAKAAAAKAEAEAQIAAAQAEQARTWNRMAAQMMQVVVDALPFAITAFIFFLFCFLGTLSVLWLVHYSRDRAQKRRDDSVMRRRPRELPNGNTGYYDQNTEKWVVIDQPPTALPAPASTAKPVQLSEAENEKRRAKWDSAVWRFCQHAERIVNTHTGQYGSFTVNDMVNVYHIVERSEWDAITEMLTDAGVLVKDSAGTRYGTDDDGNAWLSGRLRSALLMKHFALDYPLDDYGNVLPPPVVHPPTLPLVASQSSTVHAADMEER